MRAQRDVALVGHEVLLGPGVLLRFKALALVAECRAEDGRGAAVHQGTVEAVLVQDGAGVVQGASPAGKLAEDGLVRL